MKGSYISVLKVLIDFSLLTGFRSAGTDTVISGDICPLFLTKNCQCFKEYNHYVIHCPAGEQNLKLVVEPLMKKYSIECSNGINITSTQLNALPNVSMGFERLEVYSCLPEMFRFETVLKRFNATNLQDLILNDNKLPEIRDNYFEGLRSLKYLDLAYNVINNIEENAFSHLPYLTNISLESNRLRNISSNIFKDNKYLGEVRLDCNPQLIIPDYLFANLRYLERVNISSISLKNIFEHTFENCTSLYHLEMQNNKIKNLPPKLLRDFTSLIYLDMSNNELEFVPDTFFHHSLKLLYLFLNDNYLSVLNDHMFRYLMELRFLSLRNNKISSIYSNAFQFTPSLVEIDLSHNQWTMDPSILFSRLPYLEKINISHNNISIFPKLSFQTAYFTEMDVSYNSLTEINVTSLALFSEDKAIINLAHNNISYINFTGAVNLVQTATKRTNENFEKFSPTEVDLSNNPLICDCRNYELIEYLRDTLEYDLNSFINIIVKNTKCSGPKLLKDFPITDLSPQEITCEYSHDCPSDCACIRRLYDNYIVVDCSYRNLTDLPILSFKHERLELIAEGNLLKRGPEQGEGYENVTILNLSNNKLMSFDWCPPHIEKLNLSRNSLKLLNRDVLNSFEKSSNLSQLILGQNPWACACETFEFQKYILIHSEKFNIDTDNVLCEEDNIALIDKELCIAGHILAIQIIIPLLSFFFLTATAIAFYFRYKQEIKIWLFSNNWCMSFVTEEELDKDKKYDIFLSFSHKDEDFVIQNLLPTLEKSFQLCIHSRDWIPGELINNQIVDSVYNSRRTLVVLSNHFLESPWGKLEFLMAYKQTLEEGRPRVIVIKLGNLNVDKLTDDFKAYMKTNTYIEWGEPWFWKKLLYSLPHRTNSITKNNQECRNTMLNGDDEVELTQHLNSQRNNFASGVETTFL